jgi:hypothetical protein
LPIALGNRLFVTAPRRGLIDDRNLCGFAHREPELIERSGALGYQDCIVRPFHRPGVIADESAASLMPQLKLRGHASVVHTRVDQFARPEVHLCLVAIGALDEHEPEMLDEKIRGSLLVVGAENGDQRWLVIPP